MNEFFVPELVPVKDRSEKLLSPADLATISKGVKACVCVCVRAAEEFCWNKRSVSDRVSVSWNVCSLSLFDVCVCGRGAVRRVVGGQIPLSLTAKTTASSDTAAATVCFAAAARKVDSDCTGRAAGGPLTVGQWSVGDNWGEGGLCGLA